MAKEVLIPKTVIVQEAVFDFSGLYKDMKAWFDQKLYNFHELRNEQKESARGTELEIEWAGEREIDNYFKFKIVILIMGSDIDKLQAEEGSIVYQGNLKIFIEGTLIMDYKDKFKDEKFTEFLGKIYNDVIMIKKRKNYEIRLSEEIAELKKLIREHLHLYQ